jgi:HAUS augmin-like complex subunit 2
MLQVFSLFFFVKKMRDQHNLIPRFNNIKEMLRPIPAALSSCTRFFEAMFAMRESFATLQQLRVGSHDPSSASPKTPGDFSDRGSSFLSPEESFMIDGFNEAKDGAIDHRRLSWPKRDI